MRMFKHVFQRIRIWRGGLCGEALFLSEQGSFIVLACLPDRQAGGGSQEKLPAPSAPHTTMVISPSRIRIWK